MFEHREPWVPQVIGDEGWVRSSKFKEDRETGIIKLNILTMT